MNIISVTTRTITLELINENCFFAPEEVNIYLNKRLIATTKRNIYTIKDLQPDTAYKIFIEYRANKTKSQEIDISTKPESLVVDVKEFGAKGDGKTIDTQAIQAAIAACPKGGIVIIPEGIYLITAIFLKSDMTLYLQRGSMLLGIADRKQYPILPGILKSLDGMQKHDLGSWEGNPSNSFASLINGINIENVHIVGEGIIDGNANFNTWWFEPKKRKMAWRPRVIFLNRCRNIVCEGISIRNSPSWTIHPLKSENLKFINMNIENPKDSPNTDGINPESCNNVLIVGVVFSVGDDCIAIKSGKLESSDYINVPSKNIFIRNCYMKYGHGAVVIGSEMSGGVENINVENCLFENTDRGIRIKTRRGRGGTGIIDNIYVRNVCMNRVLTPFVINAFYNCDIDGKTEYVWSKEKLPVDERTPSIKKIYLKNIKCMNAQIAAGFVYGLPERKIEEIHMDSIYVQLDMDAKPDYPAMMDFIKPISRYGLYFNNVEYLKLSKIKIDNALTEPIIMKNIDKNEIL